jgi:hypothetical protein
LSARDQKCRPGESVGRAHRYEHGNALGKKFLYEKCFCEYVSILPFCAERLHSDKSGCEPDDHVYKERGANNWRACAVHTRTYSNSSRFDCFFLSKRHLKEYALVVFGPLWTTSPETTSDGDQAAASNSSTRMAAARVCDCTNVSGQNNPNKKQRLEIALERRN